MKNWKCKIGWAAAGFMAVNAGIFCAVFRTPKRKWEQDRYDCAVVCGFYAEEDGQPTEIMKSRVEKAADLWKEKKVSYLIMSGAAVHNDFVEAEVMKKYAEALGIPGEYILEEKKAVSTYHNLLYSARIMEYCGFRDCVVVTSGWHLRKADHYARKAGVSYVMEKAENPQGQGVLAGGWLWLKTSLQMYRNLWKGYY